MNNSRPASFAFELRQNLPPGCLRLLMGGANRSPLPRIGSARTHDHRGFLLPIVVFLILGIGAVFPLLMQMSDSSRQRTQFSEEWTRIQWAMDGANQKQLESSSGIVDPFSGVVTTIATFTYPESAGSFNVAVTLSEGRTLLGRQRTLSATAKAYRNGVDAGYNLDDLSAATVSVPGVAAGGEHSFAWKKDGRLFSWGRNNYGQLGLDSTTETTAPAPTKNEACPSIDSPNFTQGWMVVGGGSHTLALDYFGGVYSWGWNNRAQLGHSGTNNVMVPQTVSSGGTHVRGASDLAAGDEFSLALISNRTILAWGDDVRGQLGYDPVDNIFNTPPVYTGVPQTVVGLSGRGSVLPSIAGIAAASKHALAIDIAGNIFGWGDNTYAQLGNGSTGGFSRKPVKINDSESALIAKVEYTGNTKTPSVATGFFLPVGHYIGSLTVEVSRTTRRTSSSDYDCIELTDPAGTVTLIPFTRDNQISSSRFEWAYDSRDTEDSYVLSLPGQYTFRVARRYRYFIFFWKTDDLKADWYRNNSTDSEVKNRGVYCLHGIPTEEPTLFFGIAAGGDFSMAVRREGSATKLYTWGRNDQGQLGHGDVVQRNRMAPIANFPPTGEKIRTIVAGREHALALTESGKVYSWGNNTNGQLGRTTTDTTRMSPGQIAASSFNSRKVMGIAAGSFHSLAIDEDGKVYTWGLSSNGRLGRSGSNTAPGVVAGFP